MNIEMLNKDFHNDKNFKEQIGVMYLIDGPDDNNEIKVLRSWEQVCLPGSASFDGENPGSNSSKAWESIDKFLSQKNVIGTCHTHPGGFLEYSDTDLLIMSSLAKCYGRKYIWHLIHCVEIEDKARLICLHMFTPGHIMVYDFDTIDLSANDVSFNLPCPVMISSENNIHTIKYA